MYRIYHKYIIIHQKNTFNRMHIFVFKAFYIILQESTIILRMSDKIKYTLEYNIKSSRKVLFNRLSTAGGLSEWFADDVNVRGKNFVFIWDGTEQQAELVSKKDCKNVKFQWEEEDDDSYFEFKINTDDLTGDVALIITDFAEEDEIEDAKNLWDSQISELKHILGG